MVNYNGNILEDTQANIPITNRGFVYGDALFETLKVVHNKILFWEDHYFRLMASMRIIRMEIPMEFTLEHLEEEILKLIEATNSQSKTLRVKLAVYRNEGGLYTPHTNSVSYIISSKEIDSYFYQINEDPYIVDLYKDHYISPSLLSTLKSNNRLLNIIGGVYAKENNLHNCLLLNTDKQVVEALNANLFLVKGNTIKTSPLGSGCLKGILRKQLMEIIDLVPELVLEESPISPFELQKADELFLTNVITGIQPISQYRKKKFDNKIAKDLLGKLNTKVRLS
ncbi:aminotransferase class IV [Flavobacteriaceae sp. LMIT009]